MDLDDQMLRGDALKAIADKRRGLEEQHAGVRALIQTEMKRLRSIERGLEDCDAASRFISVWSRAGTDKFDNIST